MTCDCKQKLIPSSFMLGRANFSWKSSGTGMLILCKVGASSGLSGVPRISRISHKSAKV